LIIITVIIKSWNFVGCELLQ